MNKIPVIRGIVAILSPTIITVELHGGNSRKNKKNICNFNALIGMYVVVKTTGFSFDNILAGF